jgi:hypothetical protein
MSNPIGRRPAQLAHAAALIVFAAVALPSSAQAAGKGYYALQCHDYARDASEIGITTNQKYVIADQCVGPNARLLIENSKPAVVNQGAQFTLTAPPGTSIGEIHLDANLHRSSHHLAQIAVWNGSSVIPLMTGPDSNPTWEHYVWAGLNYPQLVLRLYCSDAGGCPADPTAHLYARNIAVRLNDWADPSAPAVAGDLLSGGWIRGAQSFSTSVADFGGGVGTLSIWVNGTGVGRAGHCDTQGLGWPNTGNLVPCVGTATFDSRLNTTAGPFHNGSNTIVVGASDYAGNEGPGWQDIVKVDNARPSIAFTNTQDPEDPELIEGPVADEHSGVAHAKIYLRQVGTEDWQPLETRIESGEARARVDSAAVPKGDYEFKATVADIAGNTAETTAKQNGQPMRLTFPLREEVELVAHLGDGGAKGQTVPYGTRSEVAGRLLDSAGEPIAHREILIDENFGEGALIRHRPTILTTDDSGRFATDIPPGPTRRITASFAGTQKYASTAAGVGELTVRSRAVFRLADRTVPEGGAAIFKGRVGHVGARIPAGGKLLELQVRLRKGRWETVGQAFRTDEAGSYKRHYRFGKHYTQDALFRFRVKVQKERNWPYKRAASKQRKLVIRAR